MGCWPQYNSRPNKNDSGQQPKSTCEPANDERDGDSGLLLCRPRFQHYGTTICSAFRSAIPITGSSPRTCLSDDREPNDNHTKQWLRPSFAASIRLAQYPSGCCPASNLIGSSSSTSRHRSRICCVRLAPTRVAPTSVFSALAQNRECHPHPLPGRGLGHALA